MISKMNWEDDKIGQGPNYDFESIAAEMKKIRHELHLPVPNPAPLGLFAFGFTTALLQVKHTGMSGDDTDGVITVVLGFAIFFGGLLQIIAGLGEIKRNNILGYTAFLLFGGLWMSLGLVEIVQILAPGGVSKPNPKAVQAMFILASIFTYILWVCTFKLNKTINLLFFLLGTTLLLLGIGVRNETIDIIGGWFGMLTSAVAYWLAAAELINDIHGEGKKEIIPLGHFNWNKYKNHGGFQAPGQIHQPRIKRQSLPDGIVPIDERSLDADVETGTFNSDAVKL